MQRMSTERMSLGLSGYISSGGKTYKGVIENVYEDDMEYLITSSMKAAEDFAPEKIIQLIFQTPSSGSFHLTCDVIWYLRPEPENKTLVFRMKIIEPPREYMEFVSSLHNADVEKKVH